jgi:branched-chain amino acid transport system permease protein
MLKDKKKVKMLTYGIILVLLLAFYFVASYLIDEGIINGYYSGILTLICINVIMAVSLNLATGFLGQLVLGHAGFMSVGAYSAALFTMYSGLPTMISFPIALLIGGAVAALFGFIIGIPALRLRGDYLAIITLGFGEIIRVLILNLKVTGGANGLSGIEQLTTFPYVFLIAVLTVVIIFAFIRSRHGRAVIAIREDEIAAEASGINTTYYKLLAFILAAFFAGIAGGLYAHNMGVLDPGKFDFNYSIEFLIMVVLGGMGSITGSVIAAIVLTILPEALRDFSSYRMLLYSVILICVMLFKPSGLMGQYEFSLSRLIKKVGKKSATNESKKGA